MLRNYFKIAFRNLWRNKTFSAINIFGLALGMTVAMLIGLWMHDELAYDKYHANYDRLGQVWTVWYEGNEPDGAGNSIAIPLGNELRTKYAVDFKRTALASWNYGHILTVGDKKISQTGIWVQPDLPEMLTLEMLSGRRDALKDPSAILLTESLAKALFGDADPMNKLVKLDNKTGLRVAGVYEDLPRNTLFHDSEFFMSWDKYATEGWVKNSQARWDNHSFQLFVQLNDHADFGKVSEKIKGVPMQHLKASVDGRESIQVHPMSRWHLYSDFKNGVSVGGRIQFVWLFGIIGVFVLLLACINFMNLSTARSEKRAKEVGIRKAVGSVKNQLVVQFLSESLLMALLAFVLAFLLVQINLPWFNQLADKHMAVQWGNPVLWLAVLGFTVFTGLLSGSYPAFYLSSFDPVKVLKGTFRAGRFASLPRKVLVVMQFTVSITLIIGTVIVFRQIQHAKKRPVGYDRQGLISINMTTPDLYGKYAPLRQELLKTGAVADMAQASSPTTDVFSNQIGFDWKGKDPNSIPSFGTIAVSHDFGKTVGWQIKDGRDFSRDFSTDTSALILNEAAVKLTKLKNPVGETIKWNNKNLRVIGVIKDLVMESPFEPIKPTVFLISYTWANVITVRLKPGVPVREALAKVEPVFRQFNPGSPFEYNFVDAEYADKFSSETRVGTLSSVFAGLAIFISCLGLFGLASFVAEQRTKEIGIRKVLGASVFNLWKLLSKDFIWLVAISFFIAAPLAWYFMDGWLKDYDYRSDMAWWVFAASGLGALAITLLTVSFQAIKAALANPVKSLRSE